MAPTISLLELLSFLQQVGYALAGAACLWGLYFAVRRGKTDGEKQEVFDDLATQMNKPFGAGLLLAAVGWAALSTYRSASAFLQDGPGIALRAGQIGGFLPRLHEGITIIPELTLEAKQHALQVMEPFFVLFLAVFVAGMFYRYIDREQFNRRIGWFYGVELVLVSLLISVPTWLGEVSGEQLFFIGHSFHSILTLGTVLILDFLLLVTRRSEVYERHIYPMLPDVSKVIWLGLAIEFASVFFIFDGAIHHTPKVLFMQTVIGVIVLNGVFLSGPLTEKLISSIKAGTVEPLSRGWELASGLAGSLSLVSWLTITFVDIIEITGTGYATLLGIYIACVGVAFAGYEFLEHYKVGARL